MHAHRSGFMLTIALLFAAPASAQWIVHVQDQTGTWSQPSIPDRDNDGTVSESEAQAVAGRQCIFGSASIDPTHRLSAVKLVGPGMDPNQAKALSCEDLGEIMGEDLTPQ